MKFDIVSENLHYSLIRVKDNVLAAVSTLEGWAGGNAAAINLGDIALVVDTFKSPVPAEGFKQEIINQFHPEKILIVNTHHHMDHFWGNQVYDSTTEIISSDSVKNALLETGKEKLKSAKNTNDLEIQACVRKRDEAKSEKRREEINEELQAKKYYRDMLRTIRLRIPGLTFEGEMMISGSKMDARLISFAEGHSPGNLVVWLEKEKVLIAGDLLFANCHPWMGDANPKALLTLLPELIGMNPEIIIPGHGNISSKDTMKDQLSYYQWCIEEVNEVKQKGNSVEKLKEIKMASSFTNWERGSRFQSNLERIYRQL